jgi:hypothetical protein
VPVDDQGRDIAPEAWRERAETAERRVLEYENAITWGVSCLACSTVLDSSYAETVRAEKAERRITRVHAIAEEAAAMRYTGGPGDAALPPEAVLGRRILAALDDSQEADRGC